MDKLFKKFIETSCSPEEEEEVTQFILDPSNDATIKEWMKDYWDLPYSKKDKIHHRQINIEKIRKNVLAAISESDVFETTKKKKNPLPVVFMTRSWYSVAAAILILVCTGLLFNIIYSTQRATDVSTKNTHRYTKDIAAPKGSFPILTLANGQKIALKSIDAGVITAEGNIKINKTQNGSIVYEEQINAIATNNTISLPKGSIPLRLVLADGTAIWLNAASSITYPTAFTGSERKVSITGEAYFEVAHNAKMPFYVTHNDMTVRVYGTHFNVSTYQHESSNKVTLLEGSVSVSMGYNQVKLKPGEQADVTNGSIGINKNVDIEEVMAWKNGRFYFNGTDLKTIMHQVENYYNVQVEFKDDINYEFYAKVDRQINISEFLKKLELTNLVHFTIEGNKVIVRK